MSSLDARLSIALREITTTQKQYEDSVVREYLNTFKEAIKMYVNDVILNQIEKNHSINNILFELRKQEFYNDSIRLRISVLCEQSNEKNGINKDTYYIIEKWMNNEYHKQTIIEIWIDAIESSLHDINSSINRVTNEKVTLICNGFNSISGYFPIKSVNI